MSCNVSNFQEHDQKKWTPFVDSGGVSLSSLALFFFF